MADLNVALILRLVDKATGPARAVMERVNRMSGGAFGKHADLIGRGSRQMAGGMGDLVHHSKAALAAVVAYKGAMIGIGGAFIRPAAEMERFKVQLANLEGSAEGADRAMAWIQEFATRTPLELNDTVAAYARLKAFGLDPTNGSLQALVDTMAASGGGAEQLDGLVIALGQAWTKQKLQGEEAMQMLERGVPVWDLLAEKLGKSAGEVQELATRGKLGRKEITLLVEALGERNKGASENMSRTWSGIISNLMDHWGRFQIMVMDAGVFDWLKGRLQQLLDLLNAAAADGRLQRWATDLAASIMAALEQTWQLGLAAVEIWQQVYPWLEAAAEWLGGWQNLMIAIAALAFHGTIIGIVTALGKMTGGLGKILLGLFGVKRTLGQLALAGAARGFTAIGQAALTAGRVGFTALGNAAIALARGGLSIAARGFAALGRAMAVAGRAALLNPVAATIAAIAAGAYVIYQNWDDIVSYFQGKIDRIRAAFDQGLINGVFQALKEANPFLIVLDAAEGLFNYITGWNWDADVIQPIREAFLSLDLVQTGIRMIEDILAGLGQKLEDLLAWFRELPGRIMAAIGSIDLGSVITWPQPPEWLARWWAGDVPQDPGQARAAALAADQRRGASLGYGTTVTPVTGARALGGPVRAGRAYRWMEEGQEIFSPERDGFVISNRQLRAAQTRQTGTAAGVSVGNITINAAPGQSPQAIAREVRRELERLARAGRAALHDGGSYAV